MALAAATFAAAASFAACAAIDPPAPFTKPEAGAEDAPGGGGPFDRCRTLERRFVVDARARVYGDPPGPQAVCVTLELPVPAAGTGAVTFCVAGALDGAVVPSVHDLTADLEHCAYCTDVETNCARPDAGASLSCATSYAPLSGSARVVRLGRRPGDLVWIDVGDLVLARVTFRDASRIDLERRDCLFADGLTLQGVLERGSTTCAGVEATSCAIANTAGSRFP